MSIQPKPFNEEKQEEQVEILGSNQQEENLLKKTKEFCDIQEFNYELELSKEEEETISLLDNPDENYLTKKGILLNNLKLIEKGFTSYGKVEIGFQSNL